jgi:hypothetical protein
LVAHAPLVRVALLVCRAEVIGYFRADLQLG